MACEDCVHFEVCVLREDFEKCAKDIERKDSFAMEHYNKRGFFVPVLTCTKFKAKSPQMTTISTTAPNVVTPYTAPLTPNPAPYWIAPTWTDPKPQWDKAWTDPKPWWDKVTCENTSHTVLCSTESSGTSAEVEL